MGAKCAKSLDDSDFRRRSIAYGKHAPDTPRSSARFLAPETRRAGQSINQIPCGLSLFDTDAADVGSVQFCKDSGTILWSSKEMATFIRRVIDPTNRNGPPQAETGLGSEMNPSKSIIGDGGSSNFIMSPAFAIPSAGSRLRWRLVWSLCDCMDESASLYLQCCNPQEKMPLCGPLHAKFTLGVIKPTHHQQQVGSGGFKGRSSSSSGSTAASLMGAYRIDMNLSHCFTTAEADWGIQEIISADEAADFIDPETDCIRAFLRLVLVSSVPPSISRELDYPHSQISAELISEEPRIILFEDFLSKADCQNLINLAKPDLQRSRVATGTETPSRTSYGTFLTGRKERDSVVLRVEEKIAQCLKKSEVLKFKSGYRKPLIKSEALQVVRYHKGEFYNEHYDNKAGNASHRAATFMIYLSDVDSGGATYFPRSSGRPGMADDSVQSNDVFRGKFWNNVNRAPPGLRIYPKQGRAVLFWSRLVSGNEDMASIHAAEAVVEGEKWIMTRWMREVE